MVPTDTCELCYSLKPCIPNRGRIVCTDCSWAEIEDQIEHEGFRIIENGREITYRICDENGDHFVTPRAWQYR